ncbi:MAG: corrinoid protein [Chloroflexi bacterium]|nr:corrinoid protein [Chloroflexota bacterium]
MAGIANSALAQELTEYVTRPDEHASLRSRFEQAPSAIQDLAAALIAGRQREVASLTEQALAEGHPPGVILDRGLIAGMTLVGIKFRDRHIFVPEVLVAARAMKAGMALLEPILAASGAVPRGTVVMGTVKGDLHDIGKNLCIIMLRGAGFEVVDLGVDTRPEKFVEAVQVHRAPVVGLSALLTTTMPSMAKTIKAFEDAGLRDSVKCIVGGAPVTPEFAAQVSADGYGKDAVACVELAGRMVAGL